MVTVARPVVAIVGRPNVGKSTLLNRVIGRREAIVEEHPGVTRDRKEVDAEWAGREFTLIDTGGWLPGGTILDEKVSRQSEKAMADADAILFVVDAAVGVTEEDDRVAEVLRRAGRRVLLVANKVDGESREPLVWDLLRLGIGDPFPVSALHGRGTGDMLDELVSGFAPEAVPEAVDDDIDDPEEQKVFSVAIVGRPNVGKSSLLNSLLGEERVIVSDIPGTTRDAIDTSLGWEGRAVRLVDTAGIRRRGKVAAGPAYERFSALRAIRAIGRADVAILVLDAIDGLTAQDAHVAGYVVDEGVGLVIAINKWDLVEKDQDTFDEYAVRVRRDAPFLQFAPIVAISALTGLRVSRALSSALIIADERRRRVTTPALNKVITEAAFRQPAPAVKGKRPRFYYATQAAIEPPTFVLFASEAGSVHFSYQRYLENRIRDAFGFSGTPIKLIFRERSRIEMELKRGRRAGGKRPPKVRGKTTARRSSAERSRR